MYRWGVIIALFGCYVTLIMHGVLLNLMLHGIKPVQHRAELALEWTPLIVLLGLTWAALWANRKES